MNDDLKAYVDGELPPEAMERLRLAVEADPALAREADALRRLSASLQRLPQPEPMGQMETMAALKRRRPSLAKGWAFALGACAIVLFVASNLSRFELGPRSFPVRVPLATTESPVVEATIPAARREAFVRFVRGLGGEVRRDGDGLRAFYPQGAHEELRRRFLLPEDLPWPTDGLRVRLAP